MIILPIADEVLTKKSHNNISILKFYYLILFRLDTYNIVLHSGICVS